MGCADPLFDALARVLAPHYARADDEARSLPREAFAAPADLQVAGDELHVRIEPLSAPRRTRAVRGQSQVPAGGHEKSRHLAAIFNSRRAWHPPSSGGTLGA